MIVRQLNPRNIIIDVGYNESQESPWVEYWSAIRPYMDKGFSIYRLRGNSDTINGKPLYKSHDIGKRNHSYRLKFPNTDDGKRLISWFFLVSKGAFTILDSNPTITDILELDGDENVQ